MELSRLVRPFACLCAIASVSCGEAEPTRMREPIVANGGLPSAGLMQPQGASTGAPTAGITPTAGAAAPNVTPAAGEVMGTTFHRDIRPLIEARCLGCHVEGGSGPFALDSWEAVEPLASLVVDAVSTRRMPPWLADSSDCRKLHLDQRLTDAQLALFEAWQSDGFPEGDPGRFVPLVEETAPVIGAPTIISTATRPHQLQAATEVYTCLQLDAAFPEDTYVTAMDLVPDNPAYVHHAIVSAGSGACSALGTVAENIYSYRPGSRTLVFAPGDALLIAAGSRLAVEFHYNTVFTTRGESLPIDASQFRMWTLPSGQAPERVITRYPFHDLTISIPVGATDAEAGGSTSMTTASSPPGGGWAPGEIIGVTPHMHVLGKSFKETLQRSDGTSICLIDVPDWDWEWQLDYFFDPAEVVPIERSDRLVQQCIYSNTADDQLVVDGQRAAPRYTRFGQESSDEMCLGYIWFRYNTSDLR